MPIRCLVYKSARYFVFVLAAPYSAYIDGTTQKLKEFRFVLSANTRSALDDVSLLVKRPRPIKTRGFMFSEASVEKRATRALFRCHPCPLFSRRFSILKYATRNWQLAPLANKQAILYTGKRVCVETVHFWPKREKAYWVFLVFFSVLQLAMKFETRQTRSAYNAKFFYDAEMKACVVTFSSKFAIFVSFFFFKSRWIFFIKIWQNEICFLVWSSRPRYAI